MSGMGHASLRVSLGVADALPTARRVSFESTVSDEAAEVSEAALLQRLSLPRPGAAAAARDSDSDCSGDLPEGEPASSSTSAEEEEEEGDLFADLPDPDVAPPLEEPSHEHRLPFEFRVLEAALETACGRLEAEVGDAEAAAAPALDALVTSVTPQHVERLKRVRGALARLAARVSAVRSELQRLLDDDSDMRDMHLSRKAAGRARLATIWLGVREEGGAAGAAGAAAAAAAAARGAAQEALLAEGHVEADDDLQDLEDLLETYFAAMDAAANRLAHLRQVITDTEEYVEVGLDSTRNKILEFNIVVGFAALVHGICSTVYGVFGMNFILASPEAQAAGRGADASGAVRNPEGHSQRGTFDWVAVCIAVVGVVVWLAILFVLRRMGYLHILPGGGRRQQGRHLTEAEALLDAPFVAAAAKGVRGKMAPAGGPGFSPGADKA